MTPRDREIILSLVPAPASAGVDKRQALLDHFGASDGSTLGLELLRDATRRRDAIDVEMALIVAYKFGLTEDYLSLLVELADAPWHERHEDVVTALGKLRNPIALQALVRATEVIPGYLDYDESRALARKAIWAIGALPGDDATEALRNMSKCDDEILREEAEHQIRRRSPTE